MAVVGIWPLCKIWLIIISLYILNVHHLWYGLGKPVISILFCLQVILITVFVLLLVLVDFLMCDIENTMRVPVGDDLSYTHPPKEKKKFKRKTLFICCGM